MRTNIVGFFRFLDAVYGIDPYDWDEHYAGSQADEIRDDYNYYCDHPEEYKEYDL